MTQFQLQTDADNHLIGLYAANDPAHMNWAANDRPTVWGTVQSQPDLTVTTKRTVTADVLQWRRASRSTCASSAPSC
ncbi:hypothetical protein L248_1036 [Schleiferilactobacillus shenzhenensis LY-73]|uniref:Uncharacterized protein n=1 Tax=Schleiferilactobacillus shenzhenensis LY-73 TaxID=1231336 RepID=U4TJJ5_9LACO|nr:hypothetical protein L248_1036 [Schleiferilactobacillus shenzhenensis LY-73]